MSASFKQFIAFVEHSDLVFGHYDQFFSEAKVTCFATTRESVSLGFYVPLNLEW